MVLFRDGKPFTPRGMRRQHAEQRLSQLLEGVGAAPDYWKTTNEQAPTLHLRRSLSTEEIAGLDPAWVALPAIDLAG